MSTWNYQILQYKHSTCFCFDSASPFSPSCPSRPGLGPDPWGKNAIQSSEKWLISPMTVSPVPPVAVASLPKIECCLSLRLEVQSYKPFPWSAPTSPSSTPVSLSSVVVSLAVSTAGGFQINLKKHRKWLREAISKRIIFFSTLVKSNFPTLLR